MMENNLFLQRKPFMVLYRFLKTYNLPIDIETLNICFNPSQNTLVDVLFIRYANHADQKGIFDNLNLPQGHLTILDYLWCTFIKNNYRKFQDMMRNDTNHYFSLTDLQTLGEIIVDLTGYNEYKALESDLKNGMYHSFEYQF